MIYKGEKTKNISFPLGGIGTGCIGLGGNGELIDWEIFNRPNKNTRNGYSHFAVKASVGGKTFTKVLHGDTKKNLIGEHALGRHAGFGYGPMPDTLVGFPHFREVSFEATFPIADVTFTDESFPAVMRLTAFNPLIPQKELDSSLPCAFFEWEIENTADSEAEYTLCFSVRNPAENSENRAVADGFSGLTLRSANKGEDEIGYLDLTILTDADEAVAEECWYRGAWQDAVTVFWKNLTEEARMPERSYSEVGKYDTGSVAVYVTVPAGERRRVRFVLAWNVPNCYNYWYPLKDGNGADVTWKNYYATQFADSHATAKYAMCRFDELLAGTRRFTDALNASGLPSAALDAVSANLSVLKSPTVLRLGAGSLWGWEGTNETSGSCEGSCQHVWNYAYALCYLFPSLERSLRENTIKYALKESGETAFRVALPLGREQTHLRAPACVDGQMGEVIKCYREWKISGDGEWLRKHASAIFSMLEYAWSEKNPHRWDRDRDGVMEGRQHHTLDMELFGPSSWLQGFYLLALDCASEMAEAVGEKERAKEYRRLYESGKRWTNENLFNGRYFCQKVDLGDKALVDSFGEEATAKYWNYEASEIKYQVADGSIIDQMLADFHAVLIGREPVFDREKRRTALEYLFKNNYKTSMRDITNMWRNFSVGDERGTLICTYPDDVRTPIIPVPYCEETMTGFEYALAVLMIAEGYVEEGETMVEAVRERYDGEKRNPWNEIECGSNYARSMASFALLPVYSGFTFDMTEGYIGFAPIRNGEYLFSIATTWGTARFEDKKIVITVLGEPLTLRTFGTKAAPRLLVIDGKEIGFEYGDGRMTFEEAKIADKMEIGLA